MTDGIGEKVNVTKVGSDGGRIKELMGPLAERSDTVNITRTRKEVLEGLDGRRRKQREKDRKEYWGGGGMRHRGR